MKAGPLQTYLINLDRSPDRLARMTQLLDGMDIPFERIPAVDGRSVSQDYLQSLAVPKTERLGLPLSSTEIAVYLSHLKAWKSGLNGGHQFITVFEDDMHFANDAGEVLANTQNWIPHDADIVKVETTLASVLVKRSKKPAFNGYFLRKLIDRHNGAGGYIITRTGMDKLVRFSTPIKDQIDAVMFFRHQSLPQNLRIYQLDPAICIQDICLPDTNQRKENIPTSLEHSQEALWRSPPAPYLKGAYIKRRISSIARSISWKMKRIRKEKILMNSLLET